MRWFSLLFLLLLIGCEGSVIAPIERTTIPVTEGGGSALATRVPAGAEPDTPDPGSETPSGWVEAAPGIEWRRIDGPRGALIVTRVDPAQARIRVGYDWVNPGTVGEWGRALEVPVLINGGYFDERGKATALVINDGVVQGSSYEGFGGMLAVGHDGSVIVRSLRDEPYQDGEELAQALQSAPLLVNNGSIEAIGDDGERARRTAVAVDQQGRLLIVVAPLPTLTLTELAAWLHDSELGVVSALNLDGGKSTGIWISGADDLLVDSLARVPLVLIIERR